MVLIVRSQLHLFTMDACMYNTRSVQNLDFITLMWIMHLKWSYMFFPVREDHHTTIKPQNHYHIHGTVKCQWVFLNKIVKFSLQHYICANSISYAAQEFSTIKKTKRKEIHKSMFISTNRTALASILHRISACHWWALNHSTSDISSLWNYIKNHFKLCSMPFC